jgi:hypothetical protein
MDGDAPPGAVRVWPPLALVVGCLLAYGWFLVLPYYANGLDRFPLEEVAAGYHDPEGMWPLTTPFGFVWSLGGLLTLVLGPVTGMAAVVWVVLLGAREHRRLDASAWATLAMTMVAAGALLAWISSPFPTALVSWWLD